MVLANKNLYILNGDAYKYRRFLIDIIWDCDIMSVYIEFIYKGETKMKKSSKVLSVALALCMMLSLMSFHVVAAEAEYSVLNDAYVRVIGRTEVITEGRSINWSQAGIEFKFTGTTAYVNVSSVTDAETNKYFNVSVDGNPECYRFKVNGTGWYSLVEAPLTYGEHTIRFTRSSEANASTGTVYIDKIKTDGEPSPTPEKERFIEFIGDSYTAGYGNLEKGGSKKTPENTDAWRAYAGYTMRKLNADGNIVAISGRGIAMNYINPDVANPSTKWLMPERWLYADVYNRNSYIPSEWNFDAQRDPHVVTVFLGTNDHNGTNPRGTGGELVKKTYTEFLKQLREEYPHTYIVAISKPSGCFPEEVTQAVKDCGGEENGIYRIILTTFVGDGADGHPYYTTAEKMGLELADFIEKIPNVWKGYNLNMGSLSDVKNTDWYYNAVKYVLDGGLMKNTTDTTFAPLSEVTRNEVSDTLKSAFGCDVNFSDSDLSKTVTKEELAYVLTQCAKAKGMDTTPLKKYPFKDKDEFSDWAVDSIYYMREKLVMFDFGGLTFEPKTVITRADLASNIRRFVERVK